MVCKLKKVVNQMEEGNTFGNSLLRNLNDQGIYPSPYNYQKNNGIHLNKYAIHDSTLREGEQTPGVHYTIENKVEIASKLDEIGVKRIEAGFPVASKKQLNSIKKIKKLELGADIIGFARANVADIDAAVEAGVDGLIITFSISKFHRDYKFKGMTQNEYLQILHDSIAYSENKGIFTIYSAEDTSREGDYEFLKQAYMTAENAGASRARIIDTLGCLSPQGARILVSYIRDIVDIPLEVHFHNDLGLALANSLAAIEAGASTISTCVNGLGERAGITSTEEAMAALYFFYGLEAYEFSKLTELSQLLESITGIPRHPCQPITGSNVLTHSSGIHQHGVYKNPVTYEFYPPNLFGQTRGIELNELSGRHGIIYLAKHELGFDICEDDARLLLSEIKQNYSNDRKAPYSIPELRRLIMERVAP
jgi:methanogen homocitrate synthase